MPGFFSGGYFAGGYSGGGYLGAGVPAASVAAAAPAIAAARAGGGYYYGATACEYELTPDIFGEHFGLVSEEARRDFFLHTQPEAVRFFIHPQPERVEVPVPVPIFVQVPVLQQQHGMSGLEAVLILAAALGVILLAAAIAEEIFL